MLGSTQPTTIWQSQMVEADASSLTNAYINLMGVNIPVVPLMLVGGVLVIWLLMSKKSRRRYE